ncbi:2034_t:CDS:1, partial [Entrophospora sp. SA101]
EPVEYTIHCEDDTHLRGSSSANFCRSLQDKLKVISRLCAIWGHLISFPKYISNNHKVKYLSN